MSKPEYGLRTITDVPKNIPADDPVPPERDDSVNEALRLMGFHPGPVEDPDSGEPSKEEPKPGDPPKDGPKPDEPKPGDPKPGDPPKEEPKAGDPKPGDPPKEEPKPAPPKSNAATRLAKAAEKLEAVADRLGKSPETPEPQPAPEPEPEDTRIEALRLLETDARSPYRGQKLVEKYKAYEAKWASYRSQWEKENPTRAFDPDDEAHDAFRDAHEPDVDRDDIIRAEARIEAAREAKAALEAQRAELRQERIRENAKAAAREAASLLTEGKPLAEIEENDPALADALEEAIPAAQRLVKLAHEMFTPGARTEWDANDPDQRTLLALVGNTEDVLAAQPPEATHFEGRRFVPAREWNRLTEKQRESCWTPAQEPRVVEVILGDHLRVTAKVRAKALQEKYVKRAAKYGAKPATPTPAPATPTPTPTPAPVSEPAPPAGGTSLQAPGARPGGGASTVDYFFGAS